MGRIIAAAHDYYRNILDDHIDEKDIPFSKNIKQWLSGDNELNSSQIILMHNIQFGTTDLSNYKIILWNAAFFILTEYEAQLIDYVASGGNFLLVFIVIL